MERIFEVVCGQLAEVFEIDHIAVYRLDSSEAGLSLIYGSGFSEESLQQLRNLKSDLGVFKRLIDTQIPQVVNDMPQTETGLLSLAEIEGFESMIAVPLLFVLAGLLTWAILVSLRWQRWRAAVRKACRQTEAARIRPDGKPFPPAERGMCDACRRPFEKVYYLPDNRRLCPGCYKAEFPFGPAIRATGGEAHKG